MNDIQPPLWADFRQFLRDRITRPDRPRWSATRRRSTAIFLFGLGGFLLSFILTILLMTTVSPWFAFGFVVVFVYTTTAVMFQIWYDKTHDTR